MRKIFSWSWFFHDHVGYLNMLNSTVFTNHLIMTRLKNNKRTWCFKKALGRYDLSPVVPSNSGIKQDWVSCWMVLYQFNFNTYILICFMKEKHMQDVVRSHAEWRSHDCQCSPLVAAGSTNSRHIGFATNFNKIEIYI